MSTEDLKKLIDELIALGEDRNELSTVIKLFPMLDLQGQSEMIESLKKEIETLKKL